MTSGAAWVSIEVIRWVEDEPQPGIVECVLTDRSGKRWAFLEKAIVNLDRHGPGGRYPQPGRVSCRVVQRGADAAGGYAEIAVDQRWIDDPLEWQDRRFIVAADAVEEPD